MFSAAAVLVCALDALGRSAATLPPIELVEVAPPEASRMVEGFVRPHSGVISLVTTSLTFALAKESHCGVRYAVFKLASIIVHEEWHVLHGADERGAYQAQLMALMRLGVPSDSRLYSGVVLSMNAALAARARAERIIAANLTHEGP